MKKIKQLTANLKRKVFDKGLSKKGFGLNEVIGIAAGILIASLVVIPGLQSFAESMINQLTEWWEGLADTIFIE